MDKKWGDIVFAHMKLKKTYWTEEMLIKSAEGYQDIETYKKENESAYTTICNRGLREKILGHIDRKHRTYTDDLLMQIAKKYKSRVAFSNGARSAYNTARNRGILEKICIHMERLVKESWTEIELKELADLCESRQDFKERYPSAYSITKKRNLLDDFFKNKKKLVIPFEKQEVIEIAKKYKTRVDFQKKDGGAYNKALRDGFLVEACKHMSAAQKFREDLPSIIYILKIHSSEHGDFLGYGITNDWRDRLTDHKNSLKKFGMKIYEIKTFECKNGNEAKKIEKKIKNKFGLIGVQVKGFKKENCHIKHYQELMKIIKENLEEFSTTTQLLLS